MPPPGQKVQKATGLGLVLRFAKDTTAQRDSRVGAKGNLALTQIKGKRLGPGNAVDIVARLFGLERAFVDVGRANGVRGDPDLGQKLEPAGRGRAQNQPKGRIRL